MTTLQRTAVHAPASETLGERDPYERATELLVYAVVLIAGFDRKLAFGASAALPLAVVLMPLWLAELRTYAYARLVAGLTTLSVVAGLLLSEQAAADHGVSATGRVEAVALLLSGMSVFALILWARSVLPVHRVVALYGAGAVAAALLEGRTSWKFDLAVPVTFVVLGLLERGRRRSVVVVAVVVLGILGVLDDGRSFFAICVLVAALTLWQMRPQDPEKRVHRWMPALFMGVVTFVVYLLSTALLTGGYLGAEAQERSTTQIETTGSLLVGGRPEWAATRELVKLRPLGYGPGVVPSWEDVQAGKAGLQSVNVELEQNRAAYMFGGQFKLHSIAADLWVAYGLAGVALAAVMLVALVRCLSFSIAARELPTSVALAATLAAWFMLFGPIYSNWAGACAGLGLVLTRATAGDGSPDPGQQVESA